MTVRKKSAQGELNLPTPSTDTVQHRYINLRGACCPGCGSNNIESSDLEDDTHLPQDGIIHRSMKCLDCKSSWLEQFAIAGFAHFRKGTNDKAARRKARRLARKGRS